ncbi:MAG: P-type conjugative transfer protein TrbG, partial [Caulobacteraceae bacterium]
PNNQAELVNYRFVNGYYIVDRLFSVAELRLGTSSKQTIRITRKGGAR